MAANENGGRYDGGTYASAHTPKITMVGKYTAGCTRAEGDYG